MKTIFITGSTDGIGKLAAVQFAKAGHKLILHGRNKEKLAQVISQIKEVSRNEEITGYSADFSDLHDVEQLGQQIITEHPVIDVLINNAGVFKISKEINQKGLDVRFVVNYLAPFVLTDLLKPVLEKSKAPRIINLSSAAQSPVSIPALFGEEKVGMQAAYAQSKLALTMWSFQLAKQWDFANIIAVNPGSLLNTKMVQEAYGQHWSPAEKGADILFDLAMSEKYAENSGSYFDNDRGSFNQAHADAYNESKINELITKTHTLLKTL